MARRNAILDEWRDEITQIYNDGYGIKHILKHLRETKPGFTGTGCNGVYCALKRWGLKARGNQEGKEASPVCWQVSGSQKPVQLRIADRPMCGKGKTRRVHDLPLFSFVSHEMRKERNEEVKRKFTIKYRTDSEFRLYHILKRRHRKITDIWRGKYGVKQASTRHTKLLGCSTAEAKQWIESQFTEGMSWDVIGIGKGKLSIDHVVPCSWFDHSNIRHAALCWNYQNLRPMWHLDNVRRSASGDGIEDHFATVPWSPVVQMLLDFAATRSMVAVA